MVIIRLILPFLLLAGMARAVDTVNNPTPAQVLTAINSTAAGGTVRIMPANVSLSWTSALTFNKNITLDLNGATITRNMPGVNGPIIIATAVSGGACRITNGRLTGGGNGSGFNARYMRINTVAGGSMRMDHIILDPSGVVSLEMNHTNGQMLVDHCTFYSSDPDEIIHQFGYGVGSLDGWDVNIVEGDPSYNAAYFEDNTFIWNSTAQAAANAAIQNYYGARTVFRHNTIWNAVVDVHGDNTAHSGRWIEIYDNDWYASVNLANCIQLRGGSGVVFNNRVHNKPGAAGGRGIILWTETPGTGPMPCQVGRGKNITPGSHTNQLSNPAYFWNNTVVNEGGGTGGMGVGTQVAAPPLNGPAPITPRDYINGTAKPGYTPAPYPHPLQGAAPQPSAPSISSISPSTGDVTYYVQKGHASAADTPSNGTEAAPFATIGYAIGRMSAGNTLLVKNSRTTPYSESLINITGPSGTNGNPCEIKAFPGDTPQINGPATNNYIFALTGVQYLGHRGIGYLGMQSYDPDPKWCLEH